MKEVVIFYGIRRSGNHGIINLIKQQNKNFVHMNNLRTLSYEQYEEQKNNPISKRNIDIHYTGSKGSDLTILSLENKIPDELEIKKFQDLEETRCVFLIRNPFNNLASVWKFYKSVQMLHEYIELWNFYFNLFNSPNSSYIYIVYDKFYQNLEYREKKLKEIGVSKECAEKFLDDSRGYAHSSWGPKSVADLKNGRASVFVRYKLFKEDKVFNDICMNNKQLYINWGVINESKI